MIGNSTILEPKGLGKQIGNGGQMFVKIRGNAADEANHNIQDELGWAGNVACMSSLRNYNELKEKVIIIHCLIFMMSQMIQLHKRRLTIWIWWHCTTFHMMPHRELPQSV